jgi:hypothetical protein
MRDSCSVERDVYAHKGKIAAKNIGWKAPKPETSGDQAAAWRLRKNCAGAITPALP